MPPSALIGSHLDPMHVCLSVVAQPPCKLIPIGVTQHHCILRGKVSRDLEYAGSKEGLLQVPNCRHCPAVQPQLTLDRHTQDPALSVPAGSRATWVLLLVTCELLLWSLTWTSTHHPPIHLSVCPCTHPPIHPPVHPPIHPPTHPPIHPSIHSSIHPPTHPSTHPPTHPSAHPQLHQFIHSLIHPTTPPPVHPSTPTPIHPSIHSCNQHMSALCRIRYGYCLEDLSV